MTDDRERLREARRMTSTEAVAIGLLKTAIARWEAADTNGTLVSFNMMTEELRAAISGACAALAHDRPSGSGLREALEIIAAPPTKDAPDAIGVSARNIARAALSGSSDPEASE